MSQDTADVYEKDNLAFEEISKWSSSFEHKLSHEISTSLRSLVNESEIKLKLFLIAAQNRQISVSSKLIDKFNEAYDIFFDKDNIKELLTNPKTSVHAMNSIFAMMNNSVGGLMQQDNQSKDIISFLKQLDMNSLSSSEESEDLSRMKDIATNMTPEARERVHNIISMLGDNVNHMKTAELKVDQPPQL